MRRAIFLYGAAVALGAIILDQIEYRYALKLYATQTYIALIAIFFTGLGLWVGVRLTRTPPAETFERNDAAIRSLGVSPRELEVLGLLAEGHSNKEIARNLDVSPNTIKTHLSKLYEKLGVERRTQAVQKARALSIIA
ncbi:MAG: LuxR C-terminal-related transcriptional regulator [Pseudomonadota bacterium]